MCGIPYRSCLTLRACAHHSPNMHENPASQRVVPAEIATWILSIGSPRGQCMHTHGHAHDVYTTLIHDQTHVSVCGVFGKLVVRGGSCGVGWIRKGKAANDTKKTIKKRKQHRQENRETKTRRGREQGESRADVQDKRNDMNTKRKRGTTKQRENHVTSAAPAQHNHNTIMNICSDKLLSDLLVAGSTVDTHL